MSKGCPSGLMVSFEAIGDFTFLVVSIFAIHCGTRRHRRIGTKGPLKIVSICGLLGLFIHEF
jgi:hypothetical protein